MELFTVILIRSSQKYQRAFADRADEVWHAGKIPADLREMLSVAGGERHCGAQTLFHQIRYNFITVYTPAATT